MPIHTCSPDQRLRQRLPQQRPRPRSRPQRSPVGDDAFHGVAPDFAFPALSLLWENPSNNPGDPTFRLADTGPWSADFSYTIGFQPSSSHIDDPLNGTLPSHETVQNAERHQGWDTPYSKGMMPQIALSEFMMKDSHSLFCEPVTRLETSSYFLNLKTPTNQGDQLTTKHNDCAFTRFGSLQSDQSMTPSSTILSGCENLSTRLPSHLEGYLGVAG
ncbi:hypothetical protein CABS01_16960 [Colletotrichum abscissum]|uniref:uncharacterized protein n=1 Tax=Colletotrichum abscissum TaxID=1671311 RepID=UPI0027D6865C|nr:uncharacterized protein CABS01_16960 [Colletotrichum abscissum]KAK1502267.1 hypothetical protein CABS01_16960 [Colletotrichum abscissum]